MSRRHVKSSHYAFLAMDFLLTTDLKVKLLEVQASPKTSFIPENCVDYEFDTKTADVSVAVDGDGNALQSEIPWACQFGQNLVEETIQTALKTAVDGEDAEKMNKFYQTLSTFDVLKLS